MCWECRGGQRALFPPAETPPVEQTVIVWTPDLQPGLQSLHVQLLLITGNSAKQCPNSPCSLFLTVSVSVALSFTTVLAQISRNLLAALSATGDMYFRSLRAC